MSFTPSICPRPSCMFHQQSGGKFIRKGHFKIHRLNQWVRRFQCSHCLKTFSSRTFHHSYRHKKMDLNHPLAKLLTEGNSLRACARLLGMTYKNTYLKFLWLSRRATQLRQGLRFEAQYIYFDEMETIHHTKCKPLSLGLVVNEKYQILGVKVAEMPAKGRLAEISRRKYGPRKDDRESATNELLSDLSGKLTTDPQLILTDAKVSYQKHIKKHFPDTRHQIHSRAEKERHRSRLHEKKQKKLFDPMFPINQRCAKLRSDIKRLVRRSWCTTKDPKNLQGHLDIYLVSQFRKIA